MQNNLIMTTHALNRSQSRCINPQLIDYIWTYGKQEDAGKGKIRYFLDRRARHSLKNHLSKTEYAQIEKKLNCYFILEPSQQLVITTAHQTKKFWKH